MAAAAAILFFFSLLSLSSSLPSPTVLNAAEILSDSGFVSMALTLQLVSDSLIPSSQSGTLFCPSDSAFSLFGQPSLSVLQLHSSPLTLPPQTLRSLQPGIQIPTMFSGNSLTVTTANTTSPGQLVSLNNVTINLSPIYDDGSLIVFGIDSFFDLQSNFSGPIQADSPNRGCRLGRNSTRGSYTFQSAAEMMRSRGYSVMASFLDLQLTGFKNSTRWTILAPKDVLIRDQVGDLSEQASLFHRHVLRCKLLWTEFENATTLRTTLEGFTVNVTSAGDFVMMNEAKIVTPNMYVSNWVVVHGISGVLALPKEEEQGSRPPGTEEMEPMAHGGEF